LGWNNGRATTNAFSLIEGHSRLSDKPEDPANWQLKSGRGYGNGEIKMQSTKSTQELGNAQARVLPTL